MFIHYNQPRVKGVAPDPVFSGYSGLVADFLIAANAFPGNVPLGFLGFRVRSFTLALRNHHSCRSQSSSVEKLL
jgi:hypothetical protein